MKGSVAGQSLQNLLRRDSPEVESRDFPTISALCCKREVEDASRNPPGCRGRLHLRSLGTRPLVVLKQI